MCGCRGTSGMTRAEKIEYETSRLNTAKSDVDHYKGMIESAEKRAKRAQEELDKLAADAPVEGSDPA